MALVPDFNIEVKQNKTFVVSDITGIYSTSNTGGYGSPNAELTDVQSVSIEMLDSNATLTTVDLTSLGLPTAYPSYYNGYFAYQPLSVTMTEDVYKVRYKVVTSTLTYFSAYKYFVIAPTIREGIDKMFAKIEDKINSFDLVHWVDDCNVAEGLWQGLESLAALGDQNNTSAIVSKLNRIITFE